MKLNKYIFATLITSTTLFLGSCSDFLDRSPQGQFTEDDNPNALVQDNCRYLLRMRWQFLQVREYIRYYVSMSSGSVC